MCKVLQRRIGEKYKLLLEVAKYLRATQKQNPSREKVEIFTKSNVIITIKITLEKRLVPLNKEHRKNMGSTTLVSDINKLILYDTRTNI